MGVIVFYRSKENGTGRFQPVLSSLIQTKKKFEFFGFIIKTLADRLDVQKQKNDVNWLLIYFYGKSFAEKQ